MLDIGWSEMFMIAVVAIVVIGPKELPRTLRAIGQWVAKARSLTREFQSNINDMIDQSEIEELRKSANNIGDFGVGNILENTTPGSINRATPSPKALSQKPSEKNQDTDILDDEIDASDEELTNWEAKNPSVNEPDDVIDDQREAADNKRPANVPET